MAVLLRRNLARTLREIYIDLMHETLADLAYRHATQLGGASIPRVSVHAAQKESWPVGVLYQPMLGIVLRGTKRVVIGDRTLRYDSNHFFIASIDVPASRVTIEDLPEAPYVAVRLAIDQEILSNLVVDTPSKADGDTIAFAVGAMTPELLDAWSRMLRLLDAPDEIDTLAPMIEREILFRLLQGPQGALLRQAARAGSRISQVRDAIARLRTNLDRVVKIEELAEIAGMSVATFHRHFRAATAMSPLQYQKTLRLQEARRLLLADTDTTSAAFAVGYESASQFSREYSRMFGTPPARDAGRLRAGRD
ncbi:AraC family transcriptional regulator N-terminal domain-containing protein (plasmid) [Agrobacterium rosae]|uniref:AraC family transcriptional regulator n=1 Tax=Agrobacterium rosae TaxID=1972867 RepID=A0AAW9FNJ3_9HYPH|nr:AraC family transcriptional regulator [Agrobacterium rosae]MDX8305137.1 AraC family transcriptional regulator [Agrobacterium rosae]MDX8316166.1 AraC family transcriptional regulator [Agrobacterium rosae]MDX8321419.1 AraC family transcriptional regulator [Agrobacterium sp. rho-8.1]MDX8333057.1 AraC family transcriptional regulator [Agrobacterium rosae]